MSQTLIEMPTQAVRRLNWGLFGRLLNGQFATISPVSRPVMRSIMAYGYRGTNIGNQFGWPIILFGLKEFTKMLAVVNSIIEIVYWKLRLLKILEVKYWRIVYTLTIDFKNLFFQVEMNQLAPRFLPCFWTSSAATLTIVTIQSRSVWLACPPWSSDAIGPAARSWEAPR